jgi:DNA-binding transcriptional ArsR family regulator
MATDQLAKGFKALGHNLRLRLLEHIYERSRVGPLIDGTRYWIQSEERSSQRELAEKFSVPASTLAHHLRLLTDSGILKVRRQKSFVMLGVHEEKLAQLGRFLVAEGAGIPRAPGSQKQVILNDSRPAGLARRGRAAKAVPEELYDLMHRARVRYFGGRGGVDYWALARSAEFGRFQRLVWDLREFDLARLETQPEAMAFWLNVYNLLYIHAVIALGIDRSVNEIETIFGQVAYSIGGHTFSPAGVEHGILRCNRTATLRPEPEFPRRDPRARLCLKRLDPRVHFAMVCGTRSCPAISGYSASLLEGQLEVATASYLSAEVEVMEEESALLLPMMFNWYREDFEEYPGGLGAFLVRYLPDDRRRRALEEQPDLELRFREWDWRLNRVDR